jgi:transcriptional regulator with XRE-family HTH domain
MSLFSDNIRYLRTQKNISQEKLADELLVSRGAYVKYESGRSEAPYALLQRLAHYYHISIDLLLSVDVRKVPIDDLLQLAGNRILLPITVDKDGENVIEIIPHKAKAGYTSGYSDPEFIEKLQQISLPFLRAGKYRAFPVSGDSMPPHKDGSFIVGRYVESLGDVMDGRTYVLLTKSEGIVYKRLNRNGNNRLVLQSNNTFYAPYEIRVSEVLEIWEYACSIETNEFEADDLSADSVKGMFMEIKGYLTTGQGLL